MTKRTFGILIILFWSLYGFNLFGQKNYSTKVDMIGSVRIYERYKDTITNPAIKLEPIEIEDSLNEQIAKHNYSKDLGNGYFFVNEEQIYSKTISESISIEVDNEILVSGSGLSLILVYDTVWSENGIIQYLFDETSSDQNIRTELKVDLKTGQIDLFHKESKFDRGFRSLYQVNLKSLATKSKEDYFWISGDTLK